MLKFHGESPTRTTTHISRGGVEIYLYVGRVMLFLESNSLLPLNFLSCFESRSERAHASVRSDVSTRLPPAVWLHPAASVNFTQPLGEKFALQSTYEYIKVLAKLRAWHHFVIGE